MDDPSSSDSAAPTPIAAPTGANAKVTAAAAAPPKSPPARAGIGYLVSLGELCPMEVLLMLVKLSVVT
jgi:hypothetical protein